jgi:hypothetical protein
MSGPLSDLYLLSENVSRSLSAENPHGEKGRGSMAIPESEENPAYELGQGWKVRPSIQIKSGETVEIGWIEGPAVIKSMWFTCFPEALRWLILRFYWDGEENPSIEVPLGDFFCSGWCKPCFVASLPINVNPAGGFNCYFQMPFRKNARITVENLSRETQMLFYQINYDLTKVTERAAYFHAQFNRTNPVEYKKPYVLTDAIVGKGQYVGTYMAWQANNNYWWGEGEIKFYMDGDNDFPTICGTGTEDYFGGAWSFEEPKGTYKQYTNLYAGLNQVINPQGAYQLNQRFGMYRFHICDPVYFEHDLKITMQALGWRNKFRRFLPLKDDISSVVYWYQTEPHLKFHKLPDRDFLEVI